MFRTTCGLILAVVVSVPAAAAPVELVKAGDAEMTCQALATEMNDLSAQKAKAAKRAESGRRFLGLAATALQVAGPMLSGGGMGKLGAGNQSGYLAQQALGSLQAQAMQQQMMAGAQGLGAQGFGGFGAYTDPAAAAPAADVSPEAQRLARLTDLHAQKGC